MSQRNGISMRSEKGLLTPDNCVVALIDHQPQMLFGVSRKYRPAIDHQQHPGVREGGPGIRAPCMVLSTVETKSFSGYGGRSSAALRSGKNAP